MVNLIGKLGDHAVVVLAALLTICGIALVFMPWQALYEGGPAPQQSGVVQQNEKGVFFVDMGISKHNPANSRPENPK